MSSSGMTGAALYAELKVAISLLLISSRIALLTWTFGHIVSAFNNFPALETLYSFGRLSNLFRWDMPGGYCYLLYSSCEESQSSWSGGRTLMQQCLWRTMWNSSIVRVVGSPTSSLGLRNA